MRKLIETFDDLITKMTFDNPQQPDAIFISHEYYCKLGGEEKVKSGIIKYRGIIIRPSAYLFNDEMIMVRDVS
jgi:hypothetical protein